jgi:hypothetical protein
MERCLVEKMRKFCASFPLHKILQQFEPKILGHVYIYIYASPFYTLFKFEAQVAGMIFFRKALPRGTLRHVSADKRALLTHHQTCMKVVNFKIKRLRADPGG